MAVCQNGDVLGSREMKPLLDPRLSRSRWTHAVLAPQPPVPPGDVPAADGRCWGYTLGVPVFWQGWRSWHNRWCLARRVCSGATLPPLVTSEALHVPCSGGRVAGCSISLPKLSYFPRIIPDPHSPGFIFKNKIFRICIFPPFGKNIFAKLSQISLSMYSMHLTAICTRYDIKKIIIVKIFSTSARNTIILL